jgi:hypothetical protein
MRKASRTTGGNHKTRSQKTSSRSKNASRAKPSNTEERQIEHLARELEEARQQQAASSRVLHIIGTSPGALTPVFQAIVKSAVEVCQARFGAVFRMEGGLLHLVADYNFGTTQRQLLRRSIQWRQAEGVSPADPFSRAPPFKYRTPMQMRTTQAATLNNQVFVACLQRHF